MTQRLPRRISTPAARLARLLDALEAPAPFGIDLDDDAACELCSLFHTLDLAGMQMTDEFRQKVASIGRALEEEPDLRDVRPILHTRADRLRWQWKRGQQGEDGDDEDDCAIMSLATSMRAEGMELPAFVAAWAESSKGAIVAKPGTPDRHGDGLDDG